MYNFNASSAFFVADHYGIFYAVSMSWINIYANDGSGCNQLVIGRESTSKIRMLSKSSEITLHFICIGEINMSGGYFAFYWILLHLVLYSNSVLPTS